MTLKDLQVTSTLNLKRVRRTAPRRPLKEGYISGDHFVCERYPERMSEGGFRDQLKRSKFMSSLLSSNATSISKDLGFASLNKKVVIRNYRFSLPLFYDEMHTLRRWYWNCSI
ncbi:hypothetical protein Bca101_059049 [Brassica carinata]